jgi:serine/threonine protein kinase
MAPEQLEGREADARVDIFAFGAVFYEMLTGRKAFEGASKASLIAAIMTREPPTVSTVAPANIDHNIRRCLAKDPDDRWHTARDLLLELRWIRENGAPTSAAHAPPRKTSARLPWAIAALAAAAALVFALLPLRQNKSAPEPIRFDVATPENGALPLTSFGNNPSSRLAVAPDGRSILFLASDPSSQSTTCR